jgi:hypothetical protein
MKILKILSISINAAKYKYMLIRKDIKQTKSQMTLFTYQFLGVVNTHLMNTHNFCSTYLESCNFEFLGVISWYHLKVGIM